MEVCKFLIKKLKIQISYIHSFFGQITVINHSYRNHNNLNFFQILWQYLQINLTLVYNFTAIVRKQKCVFKVFKFHVIIEKLRKCQLIQILFRDAWNFRLSAQLPPVEYQIIIFGIKYNETVFKKRYNIRNKGASASLTVPSFKIHLGFLITSINFLMFCYSQFHHFRLFPIFLSIEIHSPLITIPKRKSL